MQSQSNRALGLAGLLALAAAAGCSGGSAGTAGNAPTSTAPTDAATSGVYKGTITSTSSGQGVPILAMVGPDGQSAWMSADGRVWSGAMPTTGTHFDVSLMGRMHAGSTFPDGSNAAMWTMNVDHVTGQMSGRLVPATLATSA
jgi:hypothetical protein